MKNIDLNLLYVFEMLYEERQVTKAASRLHLSQSAVSHALGRLRSMLNDPLFIRVPSGLIPTDRAHLLASRMRAALKDLRSLISPQLFDATTSSRHFTISASSAYFNNVVASLIALARVRAPNISLQVINTGPLLTSALDQGKIDVALGAFVHVPPRFCVEPLIRDELVWVSGRGQAVAKGRGRNELMLNWPGVVTASEFVADRAHSPFAESEIVRHATLRCFDEGGDPASVSKGRHMRMVVPDVGTVMSVVTSTDLVALLPRRYVKAHPRFSEVQIVEDPKEKAETVEISLLWLNRTSEDAGAKWLRSLIHEATGAELVPSSATVKLAPAVAGSNVDGPQVNGVDRRVAVVQQTSARDASLECRPGACCLAAESQPIHDVVARYRR